jgi:hypothetical protein
MELKGFKEYEFADISEEDLRNITECEKALCAKAKEDIVLIAYKHQHNERALAK